MVFGEHRRKKALAAPLITHHKKTLFEVFFVILIEVMSTIDILTIIAYIGLCFNNVLQIVHVIRRHSSLDISIFGELVRLFAVVIIWYKLFLVNDFAIFLGHTLIATTFLFYLIIIIYYRMNISDKNKHSNKFRIKLF